MDPVTYAVVGQKFWGYFADPRDAEKQLVKASLSDPVAYIYWF